MLNNINNNNHNQVKVKYFVVWFAGLSLIVESWVGGEIVMGDLYERRSHLMRQIYLMDVRIAFYLYIAAEFLE